MPNVARIRDFAYYNEIDPYAAEWLERLIAFGEIAPGIVDRRSIIDVRPDDLRGFRQCHFFAGIGVWSYALRRAGWPDDAAVWTGSCPCQPFSAAGKGGGVDDERHLWPTWHHHIRECRPSVVYGEQVASQDGLGWLDLVCADMENEGYAIGALDTCSAGSGAPHIRQRLRFVARDLREGGKRLADADYARLEGWGQPGRERAVERVARQSGMVGGMEYPSCDGRHERWTESSGRGAIGRCRSGGMADTKGDGRQWSGELCESTGRDGAAHCGTASGGMAHTDGGDSCAKREQCSGEQRQQPEDRGSLQGRRQGAAEGFWGDADWLFCRDGKWRPVEPGSFPLVDGAAFKLGSGSTFEGKSRNGMLKGYGNAIDAEATIDFIEATLETFDQPCHDSLDDDSLADLLG